jgi:hypothetical protein
MGMKYIFLVNMCPVITVYVLMIGVSMEAGRQTEK